LQARPRVGPIDSKILANLLELGLFHDFPPARRKLQQFPPRAVWAAPAEWAMRGRPTSLAARALFSEMHLGKSQKHRRNTHQTSAQHPPKKQKSA
jgi:hypothetical protein